MAKGFPASKTQLRKLTELGISTPAGLAYKDAGALLEERGWDATGSVNMAYEHSFDDARRPDGY